jgi:hypothetical protein
MRGTRVETKDTADERIIDVGKRSIIDPNSVKFGELILLYLRCGHTGKFIPKETRGKESY